MRMLAIAAALAAGIGTAQAQTRSVTLDFPSWQAEEPGVTDFWKAVIAEFEQQNPTVKVNLYSIPFTSYIQQMTVRFAGNNPPDVVHLPARNFAAFASQGWLLPIDDRLARTDIAKSWTPLQSDMVWEGKTQGLLLMGYGSLLFYNEKMLEAAGVKVPTTPDEWLAAIEKTTDRNAGIFGLVATSIEHPNLVGEVGTWVHGLGLDWTRDGRWDFRNPAVVAAVEAYRRSMRFAPPGTNSTVGRQLFVDGKAAFLRDGPWVWAAAARAPEAVRPHLKVARVPFPTVTGGSSNGLHMAATLPREKQEHVWKFMELVASPKWQEQYGILSASPAPRVGSVTEETIRRLPHLKLIQEAAATAVSTFGSIPAVKENYNEFAVIFGRAVMKMISTAEPTAAILAALDADLQRAVPLR